MTAENKKRIRMKFLAPATFAFIGQITGNSRNGVLTLLFFLIAGSLILKTVREIQDTASEVSSVTV